MITGGEVMENLKKFRKAKGLKQKELADMVGVSESSISQYENGKKTPSFEIALKLAEALDCESADLVSKRGNVIQEDNKKTATANGDGNNPISEKDRRFIQWFHSLPPEKQKAILISQDAPKELL